MHDRNGVISKYPTSPGCRSFILAEGSAASRPSDSEKLKKKFQILKKSNNLKLHFQQKLQTKTSDPEPEQGDLGMEICFRHTLKQNLQVFPVGPDLNLIYIEFLLSDHE